MSLDDALHNEYLLGRTVLEAGDTVTGASRFAAGAGRHGTAAADNTLLRQRPARIVATAAARPCGAPSGVAGSTR